MKTPFALLLALTLCGVRSASAQTRPVPRQSSTESSKGFVVANGGYQVTTHDFTDTGTFQKNAEDGSVTNTYTVKGGPSFDVAGGARVWHQLAVGVGVSRFTISTPASLAASVPHPFFFTKPRTVTGSVTSLTRNELAVHIQARAVIPGKHVQAMLFGGPTFFQVEQDVITNFTYSDVYPYDSITFTRAETTAAKRSKMGFHGGADVAFFFSRQLGVGGTIQISSASIDFPSVNGKTQTLKVGGVQAGGGLRLRF